MEDAKKKISEPIAALDSKKIYSITLLVLFKGIFPEQPLVIKTWKNKRLKNQKFYS